MATVTTDRAAVSVATARTIAHVFDKAFRIPGTRVRFGLDSLLGLIPVVGDLVGAAASWMIIRTAANLGVPRPVLARMTLNAGIDAILGAIPLVGDLFDIGWKANARNVDLLERSLADPRAAGRGSAWYLAGLAVVAVAVIVGLVLLVRWALAAAGV